MTSIIDDNGTLVFYSFYNAALVSDLKGQIPANARAWDGRNKAWRVDAAYGRTLEALVQKHCGETVKAPAIKTTTAPELIALEIRYLGVTKDHGGDERDAYGFANGTWSVSIPESILRRFFEGIDTEQSAITLYGVLGVARNANTDEVKTAYRRLVKQWHPDVCREPDAAGRFRTIQDAYDLLNDSDRRARYDAGLALEATVSTRTDEDKRTGYGDGYRAPYRCGYVMAEARHSMKGWTVTKILDWQDITEQGRTLVVSWPMGATSWDEQWI